MNDSEKALVKEIGHEIVDKFMPEFIAAEESRLPDAYKGLIGIVMAGMLPKLQEFLDQKIDAVGA